MRDLTRLCVILGWTLVVFSLLGRGVTPVEAVIIKSGDGTGNTTAAGSFADPFAHVAKRGTNTAVYLGNGVVLTANHVGAGTINLGGTNYTAIGGTAQQLFKPGFPATPVDLLLYQINGDPGLTPLTRGTANVGDTVRMAGNGFDRAVDQTFWDVTTNFGPNNDVWNEVTPPPPADRSGYKTLNSQSIRWGENIISGSLVVGDTDTQFTTFDDSTGLADEAQAVNHDSGGGVFALNGGQWELVGITIAVGLYETQPGGTNTAIFGNRTYYADLSQYATQIDAYLASVPTPGTLALLFGGGLIAIRWRGTRTENA